MEVLTTGEKIKRARVYCGLTLKDISSDIISISKLSGIENNKIMPEDKIIKYLSSRLNLSEEYIRLDIPDQLLYNYKTLISNKKSKDYYDDIKYNLNCALSYEYYHIAFKFMHLLIEYYINSNKINKAENDLAEYFDLFTKANTEENKMIYYLDLGTYLYKFQEYSQAIQYLNKIKNNNMYKIDFNINIKAYYYTIMSYFKLNRGSDFTDTLNELEDIVFKEEGLECGGEVYSLLAILFYDKNRLKYEDCKGKAFKYFLNGQCSINIPINFGSIMMKYKSRDEGIKILTKSYDLYNKNYKKEFVSFSVRLIKLFIDNELYDNAEDILEETINNAIYLNDHYYIEKVYFYKALILGKKGNTDGKELYMNLSLDSLQKIGSKNEVYDRFLLVGKMYYESKKYRDSLNYFNLALKLKNKL